jgi:uncharacterized membrane protein YhaH (DUF805 family)
MTYILHALRNPFTYTGRASRLEFWIFLLFAIIGSGALALLVFLCIVFGPWWLSAVAFTLSAALGTAGFLVLLALTVRRAHDFAAKGWIAVPMLLIPPALLLCGLPKGDYITNRYGPRPPALDF